MLVELGVLVSSVRYRELLRGEEDDFRNRVLGYERAYGVRIRVASPAQVDTAEDRAVMAVASSQGWKEEVVDQLPRIYHNQLVRPSGPEARSLRNLNGSTHLLLFNETNRWNRRLVRSILSADRRTAGLVPSLDRFRAYPADAGLYLLAPARRPPREGGLLLEVGSGVRIRYTDLLHGRASTLFRNSPPEELSGGRNLLISPLSGLPSGPDGPVEWRFYMVRNDRGTWAVAGRVAKRDLLRMGADAHCWPFDEALSATFGAEAAAVSDRLWQSAFDVINTLTLFIPGIAHCAVDFWVDKQGNLTLADLAGSFRMDWLTRIGDTEAVASLRKHPVLFALFIQKKGVEKLHVDIGRARSAQQY